MSRRGELIAYWRRECDAADDGRLEKQKETRKRDRNRSLSRASRHPLTLLLLLSILSLSLSLSFSNPSPPFCFNNSKNFYDVLSVPRGANDGQIKRAYRKLALQYHPDKVTGSEQQKAAAARRFAEINAAYEALGNEEARRVYDRFGEEGLKQHQAQNAQGGGGGGGGPGGPMGGIFQQ